MCVQRVAKKEKKVQQIRFRRGLSRLGCRMGCLSTSDGMQVCTSKINVSQSRFKIWKLGGEMKDQATQYKSGRTFERCRIRGYQRWNQ